MRLKAELLREIELIELLIRQIAEVEVERDTVELDAEGNQSPVALLARLKAIGPQIAAVGVRGRIEGYIAEITLDFGILPLMIDLCRPLGPVFASVMHVALSRACEGI